VPLQQIKLTMRVRVIVNRLQKEENKEVKKEKKEVKKQEN
jgi:hypothetical protein